MGNFDANHEVTPAELAKGSWRATGAKVMSLLLERSNVDLAGNFEEIVIVPDGLLWYLPFEALTVGKAERAEAADLAGAGPLCADGGPGRSLHRPRTSRGRTWAWCWARCIRRMTTAWRSRPSKNWARR